VLIIDGVTVTRLTGYIIGRVSKVPIYPMFLDCSTAPAQTAIDIDLEPC